MIVSAFTLIARSAHADDSRIQAIIENSTKSAATIRSIKFEATVKLEELQDGKSVDSKSDVRFVNTGQKVRRLTQ